MRKKMPIILLCGIIILGITRCNSSKIGKKSDVQISQSDVSLIIKDETLTNTSATLILKNNSDKKIKYGEDYKIEIKKNEKWYKINVDQWFNLPTTELDVGKSKEINLNWKTSYGKLKKGTYRIVKDIEYIYGEGSFKNINIAVEFIIK